MSECTKYNNKLGKTESYIGLYCICYYKAQVELIRAEQTIKPGRKRTKEGSVKKDMTHEERTYKINRK